MFTECGICYTSIKNKVLFDCSHELCLKCLIQILKTKDKLICPFCRKHIIEDQQLDIDLDYPVISEINIIQEDNTYSTIITEPSIYYSAIVNFGNITRMFSFLVITTEDCLIIHDLISTLITIMSLAVPANSSMDTMINSLRYGVVSQGQYELSPVEHHIQGFFDVIIKRLVVN